MADLARIRVTWDGLGGLPGLSTFYGVAPSPGSLIADIKTFFTAIAGLFPIGLTWTVPNSGDVLSDGTGGLAGTWTGSGGGTVAATASTGAYAAGTGARAVWLTSGIAGGRRVRGSTFLCPLKGQYFDTNGTIDNTALATLQSAATALGASTNFRIWSRPVAGVRGGTSWPVTAAQVPDRVSSLRSRRS